MIKSRKLKDNKDINLIVQGQGFYIFECPKPCSFIIMNSERDGICVIFDKVIKVLRIETKEMYIDKNNNQGIIEKNGAYYWFSLDAQNQVFYAGIGEARIENAKYTYQFEPSKKNKDFLESLCTIRPDENLTPLRLLRDPIVKKIPLLVKDINDLTMMDIAESRYMPVANLSIISQKLYNCIAGKKFILNDKDFPNFSKAIEYSIATEGCWCNTKIKEKSTEFNPNKPNILETYIRITLGQNDGESPGIPYVMEIWPKGGHYSPIHNHAGAEAIIRVLHGSINVTLFPFLCKDDIPPFGNANFNKDDITWISPTLNQTHQLKNLSNDTTCITIQCYMYDQEDITHYDYFDYINEDGIINKYTPDSDMDFVEFKRKMKEEWENRPRKCLPKYKN